MSKDKKNGKAAKAASEATRVIKELKSERDDLLAEIRTLQAQRKRIERAPRAIEEQIAAMHAEVDGAAENWWKTRPAAGQLIAATYAQPGSAKVDLSTVLGFLCATNGDQVKTTLAQGLRDRATGEELTREEREKTLAGLDAGIDGGWTEFEEISCELEASGLVRWADRPGDMPPEKYLEIEKHDDGTISYSEPKLENLERRVLEREGGTQDYHERQQQLLEEERNLQQWTPQAGSGLVQSTGRGLESVGSAGREERAKRLAELSEKKRELARQYDEHGLKFKDALTLLNRCRDFLASHGVRVDRVVGVVGPAGVSTGTSSGSGDSGGTAAPAAASAGSAQPSGSYVTPPVQRPHSGFTAPVPRLGASDGWTPRH